MFRFLIAFFLFSCFLFSTTVLTVGNNTFTDKDFHEKYSRQEWSKMSPSQKHKMLNDFAKREVCSTEAVALGFKNDPAIAIKLRDRSNMALVNAVYEELVARPLVSEKDLNLAKKNIVKEVNVSHILIGFSESRLRVPPSRTKDEAFLIAQQINKSLKNGKDFGSLAKKHSDDPSASKNSGSLGWLSWGRTVQEFQEKAFSMEVGSFSKPVLTDFGYHLIFVSDVRDSEFSMLGGTSLETAAYNSTRGLVSKKLKPAAATFDSLNLKKAAIKFNTHALHKILDGVEKEKTQKKIVGQYKIDLVRLFNEMEGVGVVCVYNQKGYGIKWFANKLRATPPSRHPLINSADDIRVAFNIILLQDIAIVLGVKNSIDKNSFYKKQVEALENSLLYDSYLKWLVNSSPVPDSTSVADYYAKNKNPKYLEPPKVRIREIKLFDRELAEKVYRNLSDGYDFVEVAKKYSKTNPENGGLVVPFQEGKYNVLGSTAFSLNVGEFSEIIENLDKSYSIIRLEEKLPESFSSLKKVYSRIESVLFRELQNKSKTEGIDFLFEKYNVVINSDFVGSLDEN